MKIDHTHLIMYLADHMPFLLEDARGGLARNAEAIDKLLSDYGQI